MGPSLEGTKGQWLRLLQMVQSASAAASLLMQQVLAVALVCGNNKHSVE